MPGTSSEVLPSDALPPSGRQRNDELVNLAYVGRWDDYWRTLARVCEKRLAVYDWDAINAWDGFGATSLYYTAMAEAREGQDDKHTRMLLAAGAPPGLHRCAHESCRLLTQLVLPSRSLPQLIHRTARPSHGRRRSSDRKQPWRNGAALCRRLRTQADGVAFGPDGRGRTGKDCRRGVS